MLKILKTLAISAVIGTGMLAAVPAAQADSLYFSFGDRGAHVGVGIGDRYERRHWNRDRYERRHERRHWRQASSCSPERAVNKAYRMGIDRVRVTDVGRNTITIRGRDNGYRVRVTFARAPGCPVVG
ncbi:MAG TPA: hypothetical protein VMF90_06545 [Rhizobiaceae bacterium]|nr:hypothetical protein [Rhizobiaceae bacterium]